MAEKNNMAESEAAAKRTDSQSGSGSSLVNSFFEPEHTYHQVGPAHIVSKLVSLQLLVMFTWGPLVARSGNSTPLYYRDLFDNNISLLLVKKNQYFPQIFNY